MMAVTRQADGARPVALVTGAQGQLGVTLATRLSTEWSIVACSHRDLDVTDAAAVREAVSRHRPAVVFNCAAYTDVDGSEEQAEKALAVNGIAVGTLARAAREAGATLVHFSTDFVFDGAAQAPYTEADLPEPKSVYAQSKLVGEWMAASAPRHYVLRVESLFGGLQARSSIDRIIHAVASGREARVFHDRTLSPSFVDDVADATRFLVTSGAPPGTYHCVNTGSATWHEVALHVASLLSKADAQITPVSVADVPLKAPRPQFAALSNAKLAEAGFSMPHWQDALRRYLARARS
jgi:dTDP-4-dehydrorhamnose reductase